MTREEQRASAERLRELHAGPEVLVLPNAWDVASARVFASLPGCRAIATTSAGVAAVLGYPDGEAIPPGEMLGMVERIARAVDLPVTADLEAGYGDPGATAEAAIEAGAVGLNLEDGTGSAAAPLVEVERHRERIRAVHDAGERLGVPLVVNARTDVYLAAVGEPEERFEQAVERANAYRRAGADSLFVPGVSDAETIGRLAAAIDGPLNVLAVAGTPPVAELRRRGVARVTVGSGPLRATLALAERIGRELLAEGTYGAFTAEAIPYPELAELLRR